MAKKDISVLERRSEDFPSWRPSKEEREYVSKIRNRFELAQQARKQQLNLLNGRSLEEYWRDSEQRWNSNIPEKRQKNWQCSVVKPITRNKCVGIIANLLSQGIEPDITAKRDGVLSESVAEAVNDLIDDSQDKDRYELKQLLTFIDAVSLGTAFIQEDYVLSERKIKEIKSWDPITNKAEYDMKDVLDFEGFTSEVVSPYEIYLGNNFEYDLQKQPYLFRRVVLPYASAQQRYKDFRNWENVQPGTGDLSDQSAEERVFYEAFFQRDLEGDDVEILFYQARWDDEIAILANGILITEVGAPIPYTHKKYNLAKVVFEPVSVRFAYGKSLPDKIRGEQDVIDTLYRMIIDKTYLSIFPPLLAKGGELITSDIIVPGKITPVDTEDDLSVPTGVAGGVGNEIGVLNLIENSMNQSTIDPQHLGTPAGGQRSATQVLEAKRGAQTVLGLFGFMIAFAIEDLLNLRIQNILQFWAQHERSVLKDGKRETVRNIFQMKGKDLRDGTIGMREIEFGKPEFAPSSHDLFLEEVQARKEGKNMEKVYLDPDAIREYDFLVKVKANPSERMSPELRKALGLEFYDRFVKNPLASQEKLARETIKVMGKDPDKYLKSPEEMKPPEQPEGQEGGRPGTQSKGNITSQLSAAAQPNLQQLITQ